MKAVTDSQIELLNRLAIQLGVPTPMPKDYDSARNAITRLQGMRR